MKRVNSAHKQAKKTVPDILPRRKYRPMMAVLPNVEDMCAAIKTNNGDNGLEPIIMGVSGTLEQAPDIMKDLLKSNPSCA